MKEMYDGGAKRKVLGRVLHAHDNQGRFRMSLLSWMGLPEQAN